MSETHDLTQRAECEACKGARVQIDALSAALGQAEQEKATALAMLKNLSYDVEAELGQRFLDVVREAQGDISVNTAFKVALRNEREEIAERLATQEATIRQVEQEMRDLGTPYPTILGHVGRFKILKWADTLRAILPAEQTGEKPRCSRCHNWRERHPVTKTPGDDPLGQMECVEFV